MVEATWLVGFPRPDRAHCAFCCALLSADSPGSDNSFSNSLDAPQRSRGTPNRNFSRVVGSQWHFLGAIRSPAVRLRNLSKLSVGCIG